MSFWALAARLGGQVRPPLPSPPHLTEVRTLNKKSVTRQAAERSGGAATRPREGTCGSAPRVASWFLGCATSLSMHQLVDGFVSG